MEMNLFIAFAVAGLALIITPGADWAYAITAGIKDRSYFPAVAGLTSGYIAHTLLVTAGLASIVAGLPLLLDILTIAGIGYLCWLGINTLTNARKATYNLETSGKPGTGWAGYFKGLGTSVTNPKALLLFVALMPQFISAQAPWPVMIQLLTLGSLYTLLTFLVYSGVAITSRSLLRSRPHAAKIMAYTSGTIMILLAGGLIYEHWFW